MMYIRTSRRPGSARARMIIGIIASAFVLIAFIQIMMPYFLPAVATTIARPFWRIEFSVMSGSLSSPAALLAENEDLKRQLTVVSIQDQSVQATISENTQLLALLGRPQASSTTPRTDILVPVVPGDVAATSSLSTASTTPPAATFSYPQRLEGRILAAVLVRPPLALYDELIVDVGSDQGIATGASVYAPGGVLIGTTTVVLGQTSKVSLFSSPGETYPVLIGPGNVPATAIGRGGGQYEADVPQASTVKVGDAVLDPSFGDAPFGIVSAVIDDPVNPFETILFAPPVNLYSLRWVLVDTSPVPAVVPSKKK